MNEDEIMQLVVQHFPEAEVAIGGDGRHIDLHVVCDGFEGLSRLKRQQAVYAALNDAIRSGAIHAVNIKAQTRAEAAAAG